VKKKLLGRDMPCFLHSIDAICRRHTNSRPRQGGRCCVSTFTWPVQSPEHATRQHVWAPSRPKAERLRVGGWRSQNFVVKVLAIIRSTLYLRRSVILPCLEAAGTQTKLLTECSSSFRFLMPPSLPYLVGTLRKSLAFRP
jgi:hypothetical protein